MGKARFAVGPFSNFGTSIGYANPMIAWKVYPMQQAQIEKKIDRHPTAIEREQRPYDEAALDIIRVLSKIHPSERIGVIDLARARVVLQNAMSDRVDSDVRDNIGKEDRG